MGGNLAHAELSGRNVGSRYTHGELGGRKFGVHWPKNEDLQSRPHSQEPTLLKVPHLEGPGVSFWGALGSHWGAPGALLELEGDPSAPPEHF